MHLEGGNFHPSLRGQNFRERMLALVESTGDNFRRASALRFCSLISDVRSLISDLCPLSSVLRSPISALSFESPAVARHRLQQRFSFYS